MTVRRGDTATHIGIPNFVRNLDRDAPGKGHITFTIQETLTGKMNSDERCRAGRANTHAWPFQVQFIRNLRRQVIFLIANGRLHEADPLGDIGITMQVR